MPVIIIPIIVGLLTALQKWVYKKYWDRNLDADVTFGAHSLQAGNDVEISERMANAKLLPLPWVTLKFEVLRNGKTDNLFRSDLFNILFNQQIVRKSRMKLVKRGVYQIRRVSLFSSDLFISSDLYHNYDNHTSVTVFPKGINADDMQIPYEKLMGDIATKRYTMEDPFLFRGIREYQPQDGFKDINFKASARNNRWLVNTHEYTVDQKVRILLLADRSYAYADEAEYEAALSYAAELTKRLEDDGIPVMLETNALDSLEGAEPQIEAGCSPQHVDSVMEILSRLDLTETGSRGEDRVRGWIDERAADEYYVILSPEHGKEMLEAYRELRDYTDACMYISPVAFRSVTSMTEAEKRLPDETENFFFYSI